MHNFASAAVVRRSLVLEVAQIDVSAEHGAICVVVITKWVRKFDARSGEKKSGARGLAALVCFLFKK